MAAMTQKLLAAVLALTEPCRLKNVKFTKKKYLLYLCRSVSLQTFKAATQDDEEDIEA